MNQQDQQAIDELFRHLNQTTRQAGPRDPEAEARIQQLFQQGPPGLLYQMAQTLVAQQHTLNQLRAQLAAYQQQGGGAPAGFAPPAGQQGYGYAPGPQPVYQQPVYQQPVYQQRGGGFLAGAGQLALGIGGGILGAEAIGSLFGGGGLFGDDDDNGQAQYDAGYDAGFDNGYNDDGAGYDSGSFDDGGGYDDSGW